MVTPEAVHMVKSIFGYTIAVAVVGQIFCALFDGNKWTKLSLIMILNAMIYSTYYMSICKLLH
jgi:hypothetical protein